MAFTVNFSRKTLRSQDRKLALIGWLRQSDLAGTYENSILLQKYLFFFESFCKVLGLEHDFKDLEGRKHGPVFSSVLFDYETNNRALSYFADKTYDSKSIVVDSMERLRSAFAVSCMSPDEASDISHYYHLWASKSEQLAGKQAIPLNEADFNDNDISLTNRLRSMYSDEVILNSHILSYGDIRFVVASDAFSQLTEADRDTLKLMAADHVKLDLCNPVYVSVDDEGGLLID